MAEQEKLVTVKLSRPFTTNGVVHGYKDEIQNGKKVKVFTGEATVSPELAEDLQRRDAEYNDYLADLNRDKGGQVPVVV